MFEKPVVANEFVITQGEEGDYFYVIEHGLFEIFVNGQLVLEVGNGGSFGELALMYNVSNIYFLIIFFLLNKNQYLIFTCFNRRHVLQLSEQKPMEHYGLLAERHFYVPSLAAFIENAKLMKTF
jgi:CRP-like cAMP-binding protein